MSAQFVFDRFCHTVVREARDAVIFADRDGIIRFWNAGAQRIFGFKEAEATGRSLDIIIPEDLRARHWSGFKETMRTGKTRYGAGNTLAVRAMRKDGRPISIEFSIVPFRGADGAISGIAAILRGVHERTGVSGANMDWMTL